MDSIDQIRKNIGEVDMLLNYASHNKGDIKRYQMFNKASVVLLSTKFEVFLEEFIDEHSRLVLAGHTNATISTELKNKYIDTAVELVRETKNRAKKNQYLSMVSKLLITNGEPISSFSSIRPSTKFSFGKHGQKEIESLFERHGLKAFITSAPIRNSLQMINSLFSIRNNVIHEDASPSLTHQTIKAHKDNIMHFVDLLEIDITANHKAYYNN